MIAEAFRHFPQGWLSSIGLLLFLSVFLAWTYWAYRPRSQPYHAKMSALPLDND